MQRWHFGSECGVAIASSLFCFLPQALAITPKGNPSGVARPETLVAQVPSPSQIPLPQLPDPSQLAPDPNRDRLIQPGSTPAAPEPSQPVLPPTPTPTPSPETSPEPQSPTITVTSIKVIGSTILGATELDPLTQPLEGQTVTLEQLRQVG
jgi:hemolysin activation/secretion protein